MFSETIRSLLRRLHVSNWRLIACIVVVLALALPQPISASPGAVNSAETIESKPAAEVELPPGTMNIALLGVDKRPSKNFNNTDVIVIASINPDIPAVTLLSIPRDWPAYIPGVGVQKINTAFAIGGPKLFRDTLMHNFGLRIDYYAMVNFEGLVRAVDTLGGVETIATCRLYHVFPKDPYYMGNTYVVTQKYVDTFTGDVWKVGQRVPTQTIDIPKAGVYTLTGLEALAYVRARYGVPGGDVDRGRREQRIVRALFSKAKQINAIPKFPELFSQFQEYVKTDLPLDKLLYFAGIADRFDDMMIRSRFLDAGGANGAVMQLDDNAAQAGGRTYEALIQQMLSVALNQRPNDGIPIEVWNGTNDPGFGSAAVDRLNELGFNVTDIKAADRLYDQTTVVDFNTTKKGSAIPLLQRNFGIRAANIINQPTKDGPRYRIIIGPDFKTCYYDDTYVLALRGGGQITDPSVSSTGPATPTLAITPTPLPDTGEVITQEVPTADVTDTNMLSPTGLSISVPLGDLVNVRSGPDVRYPVIGQLAQEQSAPLTGQTGDGQWWQIDFNHKPGWVASEFVQVSGDSSNVPTLSVPPITQVLVPVGDVVNVRRGPGMQYALIARLRQRQSALIIGKTADGAWLQIRIGNSAGWIASAYVRVVGDLATVPVTQP